MGAPWWGRLVPVLMLGACSLALVDQGTLDAMAPEPQDIPPRPALPCHKVSVSNIDFAFSLYRQLALRAPGENILFSPASISLALATLSLSVPEASRALLLEGLGFNLTVLPEAEVQAGFLDLLLQLPEHNSQLLLNIDQHLFSGLSLGTPQNLEEAQKRIAEYLEKQTHGRLGAWEDLRSETTAVLLNHVFLRAKWAQPFDPHATSLREFFVDEHRAVQVPMVRQKARHRLLHDPELRCTVLHMDHAGGAATYFVFPRRGRLEQLEGALLPETLIKWDSLLRTRELDFYFPKFSISSTFSLETLLPQVPVGGGFPGQSALNVSKVTHRAVMSLDEEGSEAAAATGIQLTAEPRADLAAPGLAGTEFSRPFLVLTFHTETGSLLFLGKVVNPLG